METKNIKQLRRNLESITALRYRVEVERERIAELHGIAVYCGAVLKKTPGVKSWDKDKIGRVVAEMETLEKQHIATLQELTEKQKKAEKWFDSLPESLYKTALYLHFFEDYEWLRVQHRVGNRKSADALRMGVNKLLEAFPPPEL